MSATQDQKPIESYLAELGLHLSDQERKEIALAVRDARVRGIGYLLYESGAFHCGDPLKYAISQIS